MFAPLEKRMLERARRGDPEAWNQVVDKYKRLVYSIPMRLGLSADDASDVFQTTFLTLHRELERIESVES